MVEEKVKVKELAEQLGAPAREMLRALHGLKVSAKSMSGSVTMDEAVRLPEYFANRKTETVER
ncbi:MAG: translation initiation factor IF-2 N-terminal domain-containing protein, partial [Desulfovibrio sp.]|nr:translation initiation factor IF-2 N-terminal domain-containing protein [Desulfovibrio sp.]